MNRREFLRLAGGTFGALLPMSSVHLPPTLSQLAPEVMTYSWTYYADSVGHVFFADPIRPNRDLS